MSIKAVVGIVVALAVVGAGAWYLATHQVKRTVAEQPKPKELTAGSFSELMAREGAWECEATAAHEEGVSTGIVVMNGGKLRGDFVAIMDGVSVSTSFIHRDGVAYTWTDMLPQGFKVAIDAAAGTAGGQGIDPSTQVDYSCAPWTPDESAFEVPSGMTFIDVSAMGAAGAGIPMPR